MSKLANIKLIVTDLDGTVLEHGQLANDVDQEVLLNAAKQNIGVTIATGQSWHSAKPRADFFDIEDHLDLVIVANGAMISKASKYEPLYYSAIDADIVKKVFEKMIEMNVCVLGFYLKNQHVYWNGIPLRAQSLIERNWIDKFVVEDLSDEKDFEYTDVIQLMIFVPEEQEIEFDYWLKSEQLFNYINSMKSNIESMPIYEFININASKGNAIKKLAKMININLNEIIIFGDNMNDISMFTEIPNSVAMGNAVEPIKEIAKYITDTNKNGGVGKFITQHILKEEK
ncbi:Cof-type HAD-IIB family hydrolase [Mesoplasma syrphidae]|uniref:Cof-type HAD-IIB family hydrolase n=1 Tax=Mesoplasma syrphidae TaxID=225999 RepID=A0A2K9C6A2_9MOLU|nr:HAD family hydrolase [Mesoplasma syrphidae]AUF83817.1 Cof-type HAD-IIB family hydrolase [Mesoplasma syrphidae]